MRETASQVLGAQGAGCSERAQTGKLSRFVRTLGRNEIASQNPFPGVLRPEVLGPTVIENDVSDHWREKLA